MIELLTKIATAFVSLTLLGFFIGLLLALAAKLFHVEVDPKREAVESVLPGTNCGACGMPGCAGYAEQIVENGVPLNLCLPGGDEVAAQIAQIMGQELTATQDKKVGFVFCKGGCNANDQFTYSGEKSCAAAGMIWDGYKLCDYGCLGFGDCVVVCKFNAIHMDPDGYPVIDETKCVNCAACYKACPKNLIKEVPLREVKRVICSSHDNGKVSRKACSVACIGCGLCVKNCPYDAITLDNGLAIIDARKCTNCGVCVEKCPTKAIA